MDSMSHDMKRKEIQIKELQSRLDSGDGCKYNKKKNSSKVERNFVLSGMRKKKRKIYENVVFIVVTRAAAVHAVYAILKNLGFSSWLFGR